MCEVAKKLRALATIVLERGVARSQDDSPWGMITHEARGGWFSSLVTGLAIVGLMVKKYEWIAHTNLN